MSRIVLVHWNAVEWEERAVRLRAWGHTVDGMDPSPAGMRALQEAPPEVFVIDLSRAPSQGRDAAHALRQRKATRAVPLVFAGGDPDKLARMRELLPDAVYTEWRRLKTALQRVKPPANPVVPGVLAGYSGTPLPKKLGIKPDSKVALLGAPPDFQQTLGTIPDGARLTKTPAGAHLILLFARSQADLARRFAIAAEGLAEGGGLWIIWPKKASGVATDLTEQHVRAHGLARQFVDYKICAVDQTWSGLKFARRR
jgi:CheY-like chemotaxis protein